MRRIQRDVCHEEFIKSLTTGDAPVFREIWRLLLFAAFLGIKDGRRVPIEKADTGRAIPDTYFSTPAWPGVLYLIGIANSGDSECLQSTTAAQDGLVTAFEEYANHGLHLLRTRITSTSTAIDEIVTLLLESSAASTASPIVADLI